jgi:hypothetical protein
MRKKSLKTLTVLLLWAWLLVPTFASTVKELTWADLIPTTVAFDDPFAEMDRENLEYLGFVARIRSLITAGKAVSQETRNEAAETEAELIKDGIDVDGLLARRDEIRELRKKRAGAIVKELDGASIRIPGYLLPLDYSGRKVTEFLLVPWVGACIHTPPPPPNQIIYVLLNKDNAFESRSIYEPVWVAGEISTQASTKNLFLKDGSNNVDMSYKLQATLVERYKQ